ncbi:MAG: hypothetical protein STHCBS139747_007983 [Sporothrix thermara]
MSARGPNWELRHRPRYAPPPPVDPYLTYRKHDYAWDSSPHVALEALDSQDVSAKATGHCYESNRNNASYSYQSSPVARCADYSSSDYHFHDRPSYGSTSNPDQSQVYHGQPDSKHTGYSTPDSAISVTSSNTSQAAAHEHRRYLPSPPHVQTLLAPAAAKTLEDQSGSARSVPLSPSSLSDTSYHAPLHKGSADFQSQETSSAYSGATLVGVDYGRAPGAIFGASSDNSTPDAASLPAQAQTTTPDNHRSWRQYTAYPAI